MRKESDGTVRRVSGSAAETKDESGNVIDCDPIGLMVTYC